MFSIKNSWLAILLSSSTAFSQPTATISASPSSDYRSVIFDFIQNDLSSMEGCHYNLFASGKRSDLSEVPGNGKSIATFYKPLSFIQIIANPIKLVARKFGKKDVRVRKNIKIFFRALLSCPGSASGMSNIALVSLKTFPKGKLKTVHEITKQMKNHMAYYYS